MKKYKTIRKKLLAGMLITVMATSSVVTNGFGTSVHELVKAETVTTSEDFIIADGLLIEYIGTAEHVVIPNEVTEIKDGVFRGISTMTKLTIPSSVKRIGIDAFWNCYKLKTLEIEPGVETIDAGAFAYCYGLESIELPEGIKTIDTAAFDYCGNLTDVVLSEGLESLNDIFSSCKKLKSIVIPASVQEINNFAFYGSSDELVIKGYAGTKAEEYATRTGRTFVNLGTAPTAKPVTSTTKPTATSTVKPMVTSTVKPIATPTVKPTATPTMKPTATPTVNPTVPPTAKPTATPTVKPTATPTVKPTATPTVNPTATPIPQYTITFNAMGGTVNFSTKQVTQGESYGTLPTPVRTGYNFMAWCEGPTGGMVVTNETYVYLSSNQTLYAIWNPKQYKVTLDAKGGTVSENEISVSYERAYETLPTPKKENANFVGWYTEDNQLVTNATYCNIAKDHTLHAVWEDAYQYRAAMLESLSYQFGNNKSVFGYPSDYRIPLERYQYIYGDTILAKSLYTAKERWGGNCFGMSSTSIMFHTEAIEELAIKDFNAEASALLQMNVSDVNPKLQLTLTQMIEAMQISQYDSGIQQIRRDNFGNLDELCKKVEASQNAKGNPVLICLYGPEGGHAVVGYKISGENLYVYDPNYPTTVRSIKVTKNEQGEYVSWYYHLNDAYDWMSGKEECRISYVPFEAYKQVWNQRSTKKYANTNMLTLSTENAMIYDVEGKEVAKIKDGELETQNSKIYQIETMELDENAEQGVALYLPTDLYVIENTDKEEKDFTADMTNVNQGVSVTTEANKITFAVSDEERINSALCNAGEGQSYSLSLQSAFEDDKQSVEISGTGTSAGEVGISQSFGNVGMKNCDFASVSVNGEKVDSYVITSKSSEGGMISLQENETIASKNYFVVKGGNATYVMTPDDGYILSDVLVDGRSVGAVPTYTFENVTEKHTIVAVFVKFDASAITVDKIKSQTYTGQSITPTVTVRMNDSVLKENIDYSVVYSNNKNVGTAKATIIGIGSYKGLTRTVKFAIAANKGESYTVGGMKYQVTNTKEKQVTFVGLVSKKKTSVIIPKTVKIGSTTYKVTKIAAKAFNGCSKLKKITIKSTYLTSIGSNAFKGIYKNAVIKVPASKLTKYKKLMKNKGQKKTVKIKK